MRRCHCFQLSWRFELRSIALLFLRGIIEYSFFVSFFFFFLFVLLLLLLLFCNWNQIARRFVFLSDFHSENGFPWRPVAKFLLPIAAIYCCSIPLPTTIGKPATLHGTPRPFRTHHSSILKTNQKRIPDNWSQTKSNNDDNNVLC